MHAWTPIPARRAGFGMFSSAAVALQPFEDAWSRVIKIIFYQTSPNFHGLHLAAGSSLLPAVLSPEFVPTAVLHHTVMSPVRLVALGPARPAGSSLKMCFIDVVGH